MGNPLIDFWVIAIFIGLPALVLFAVVKLATGIARYTGAFRPRPRGPMCQYCGVQYPHHTKSCPRDYGTTDGDQWGHPIRPDLGPLRHGESGEVR